MAEVVLEVREQEDIAKARRAARASALGVGMDRFQVAEVETSTSELAANLVVHTQGGTLTVSEIQSEDGRRGVMVVTEDSGPGIADLELALREGYSSKGGLGSGLPAVRRMMDSFDIASAPGEGTKVTAVKWL